MTFVSMANSYGQSVWKWSKFQYVKTPWHHIIICANVYATFVLCLCSRINEMKIMQQ